MEHKSSVRRLGYAVGAGVLLIVLLLVLGITTGFLPWRDSYADTMFPYEDGDTITPIPSDSQQTDPVTTPTPTPTPTPLVTPNFTLEEELPTYTVTVAFGKGGTAIPYGANTIVENGSVIVQAVPDEGYVVEEMIVDGENIGPVDRYEIESVNRNHSIYISFIREMFAPATPTPTPEVTPTPTPEITPTPVPEVQDVVEDEPITE